MRACLTAVLALALAACGTVAPSADAPSPEAAEAQAVVRAYIDAFNAGDVRGAAELMDPVQLAQFVDLMGTMMALDGAPADAGPVPEDDPAAFAWFLDTMSGTAPGLADAMQNADAEILGAVAEGDSLIHVVMRTSTRALGLDMKKVSTTTTRRRDGRWTVALSGDLDTFAQAMRQVGGPFPMEMEDVVGDGVIVDDDTKLPFKPGRDR